MYDDVLIVVACEVIETLLHMRRLLTEAQHARKHANAMVAAHLRASLDSVQDVFGHAVLPVLNGGGLATEDARQALATLATLAETLRYVHEQFSWMSTRWAHAEPAFFVRKLREDGIPLTPPVLCLTDHYSDVGVNLADRLPARLAAAGIGPVMRHGDVLCLPRASVQDPLSWGVLLEPVARILVRDLDLIGRLLPGDAGEATMSVLVAGVQARLGGPAALASAACSTLFRTGVAQMPPHMLTIPNIDQLATLAAYTADDDATVQVWPSQQRLTRCGLVDFYTSALQTYIDVFGSDEHTHWPLVHPPDLSALLDGLLPVPALPDRHETGTLFNLLLADTPINALPADPSADFMETITAAQTPATFYRLLEQAQERPISATTIMSVGWMYKMQQSYALLRDICTTRGALGDHLDAYAAHMQMRDNLLQQSIEAASVQHMFVKWKGHDQA